MYYLIVSALIIIAMLVGRFIVLKSPSKSLKPRSENTVERNESFAYNGESISHKGMNRVYRLMNAYFGDKIELQNLYGPGPECTFVFTYVYKPRRYTIVFDCERGFLCVSVKNENKERGPLHFVYPELLGRSFFEDQEKDVDELIKYLYNALTKNKISFYSEEEIIRKNKKMRGEEVEKS
ncbi:MAG: hypothetical protein MJ105_01755 [Lachnospiraceae bacterium]|nr:hypothetical protein [Lachnospiraceae bacterium]